jgi:hypothetical protein
MLTMSPEDPMSAPSPQVQPSVTDRASRHAARLRACWPSVQVESALLTTSPAGDHGHAVVQLGGLTPADVRVELLPLDPALAERSPRGGYRLFSSQAYGNGCFVFEVALPAGSADQGGEWIVHVHPTEADEDTRVEFRVQPRVAGARR